MSSMYGPPRDHLPNNFKGYESDDDILFEQLRGFRKVVSSDGYIRHKDISFLEPGYLVALAQISNCGLLEATYYGQVISIQGYNISIKINKNIIDKLTRRTRYCEISIVEPKYWIIYAMSGSFINLRTIKEYLDEA